MANEAQIFIKGNFLVGQDITSREQFFRVERDQIRPNRTNADVFFFTYKSAIANNIVETNRAIQGSIDDEGRSQFAFADIVDVDGLPYADADTLDQFLCDNLGSLEPAILPTPASGLQSFFLAAKGNFGTGGGWADNGFLGDVPVLYFDKNTEERQITSFYAFKRMLLTTDPVVGFVTYTTGLPVLTTGDGVRWRIDARYIGEGEKATKAIDESIFLTQTLDYLITDTRQSLIEFTLDKALIDDQDSIQLTFSRVAGDAADNYNFDIAVGQAGMSIEVTAFNP